VNTCRQSSWRQHSDGGNDSQTGALMREARQHCRCHKTDVWKICFCGWYRVTSSSSRDLGPVPRSSTGCTLQVSRLCMQYKVDIRETGYKTLKRIAMNHQTSLCSNWSGDFKSIASPYIFKHVYCRSLKLETWTLNEASSSDWKNFPS
jgi:hypothetical protein